MKARKTEPRPDWLRKRLVPGGRAAETGRLLGEAGARTVCSAAGCPNQGECYGQGVAAFLILGPTCSRRCRFCGVTQGRPAPEDPGEPGRVAAAAAALGLTYAVVTSVTRDDLPDGGAGAFVRTIEALSERAPGILVEVLTPDFGGRRELVGRVAAAGPAVYNHNLETVPSLYEAVRPGADYRRSLAVLEEAAARGVSLAKSGLMLGLGETAREVRAVMADLRAAGCRILTLGQYLSPGRGRLPVTRYIPPAEFEEHAARAKDLGFDAVAAGPFVRSSHFAAELFAGLAGHSGPGGPAGERTENRITGGNDGSQVAVDG